MELMATYYVVKLIFSELCGYYVVVLGRL